MSNMVIESRSNHSVALLIEILKADYIISSRKQTSSFRTLLLLLLCGAEESHHGYCSSQQHRYPLRGST